MSSENATNAAPVHGIVMRWVHAKPTEDGWYWNRDVVGSIVTPRIVHVMTMRDGVRHIYYAGRWQVLDDLWRRFEGRRKDFQFSDLPIEQPVTA